MTAFEKGYDAFLRGTPKEQNPFDDEDNKTPWSKQRWDAGWSAAMMDRRTR